MDRQWRPSPPPIQLNLCPTCFLSHFPFCPPPPPDHTHPFLYPNPNPNPNPIRNFKRPRIDDNPLNFSDDERRLKLIRDHGSNPPPPPHSFAPHPNQNGAVPPPHFHNAQFRSSPHPFHAYAHTPPHVAMHPQPPHEGNLNGRVPHYPYPYPTSNNNNNINTFRAQPPLPSSPPPPLPMEPSINQLNTYFSPPTKPPSLFPVAVGSSPSSFSQVPEPHSLSQPYYHAKPLPEYHSGFPSEVPFSFVSGF